MLRKVWLIPKADPDYAVIETIICLLVPPPLARYIIRTKLATDSGQTCRVKFPLSPVEHLQPRRRYVSRIASEISRHNEFGMLCEFPDQIQTMILGAYVDSQYRRIMTTIVYWAAYRKLSR